MNQFAKIFQPIGLACSAAMLLSACGQQPKVADKPVASDTANLQKIWPKLDIAVTADPKIEARIQEILAKMTLEQKVAQVIQPEIRDITVEDMRRYGFGSYLNGGGAYPNNDKHASAQDWIALAEKLYQASIDDSLDGSSIPTMWGTDAVHGHNNVIGATLFPHNIGLGAAHNPELITQVADATATEVLATGIDWIFAPTVATVRDDRWGRTYEGYSEDPEIVSSYAKAIVEGLQGAAEPGKPWRPKIIATVKHFLGDGGTLNGDDQGDNIDDEQSLFDIHAQGYVAGLSAGAQTVMASFNSWHGKKNHGSKYLLTDVLKDRMGFDGLVVGDWNGHGQVAGCTNEDCPASFNAGLDIFMVPTSAWKPLYENTIAEVKSGVISQSRLDDAVTRILRVKLRAGIFDMPSPANRALAGKENIIGNQAHRDIARQAVRESLVLLKNKNHLLPLSPKLNVLVAGDGADNIGKQSGGWSITWQGTGNENNDFPGGTSIYAGIAKQVGQAGGHVELSVDGKYQQRPDVAIVVFGEEPYAEGNGDIDNMEYQRGGKHDLALLQSFKQQNIPVVSIFLSGRPMWVNPELNASDAFVTAWLPGSEGGGIAEVLFTDDFGKIVHDFKGTLSFSWPKDPTQTAVNRFDADYDPLFPYGFGLNYSQEDTLTDALNEVAATSDQALQAKVLLQGTVKAPWQLTIKDAVTSEVMNSSVMQNQGLNIRTIDKQIQEDARQVSWNGTTEASVSLASSFPEDLRAYLEAASALSFALKIDSAITAPVKLGMSCGDSCSAQLDIGETLASYPTGQWQSFSVDLACFVKQGADLGRIFTPFSISSSAPLDLTFADISIEPKTASSASVICQ
jgi:beta-glucosidase